jgi:hypothetical protein
MTGRLPAVVVLDDITARAVGNGTGGGLDPVYGVDVDDGYRQVLVASSGEGVNVE